MNDQLLRVIALLNQVRSLYNAGREPAEELLQECFRESHKALALLRSVSAASVRDAERLSQTGSWPD